MNHNCVLCGKPTDDDDERLLVYLHRDPRVEGWGLSGSDFISFHTTCELARQARVRQQEELEAAERAAYYTRQLIRRGLRWRRRLRFWQRLFGIVPQRASSKQPVWEELA